MRGSRTGALERLIAWQSHLPEPPSDLSSAEWQTDRVGDWNLGSSDEFLVGNSNGGAGWADLFVRNSEWFGMLRWLSGSNTLDAIFRCPCRRLLRDRDPPGVVSCLQRA